MELTKAIRSLCSLAKRYELSKKAFTPSTGEGALVVHYLEVAAGNLKNKNVLGDHNLEFKVSKGRGNLPKILWIAALPAGFSPADSLSVTICIGKKGDGIVFGLMVPQLGAFHDLDTQKRIGPNIIDVDGNNEALRFNNCYINPMEMRISELNETIIIDHMKKSIELLNKHIEAGTNSYRNLYSTKSTAKAKN
jgi:hypothetical protein